MSRIAVAGATGRVGRHVADVLQEHGHEVVRMSRATGVDVVTGEGLAQALEGVDTIVDAATGPSPDEDAAREFFSASARNLQGAAERAGVRRIVVVSIIGTDRHPSGYGAAKLVHEQRMLAGPVPAVILRAAQFHEFVEELLAWSTQGDVAYLPRFRTQLVAARAVGEELARLATAGEPPQMSEIAGPREERLAEAARLLVAQRGDGLRIEEVTDPNDPMSAIYDSDVPLPGPDAKLAGPTFEEWLATQARTAAAR